MYLYHYINYNNYNKIIIPASNVKIEYCYALKLYTTIKFWQSKL